MSRTAIISDIHSNWQALQAVWTRIEELDCNRVFCLGDIVGYGARPVECLEFLRSRGVASVQGNHDALVADPSLGLSFNAHSLVAVSHNRALLDGEQREYLRRLPTRMQPEPGLILSHGSPGDRDRYLNYLGDWQEVARNLMRETGPGLCFFGHTHFPVAFDGQRPLPPGEKTVPVAVGAVMLFNPGSVGQPRDGDPRASFLYWDDRLGTINFQRVSYDVEAARQEILAADLPVRLGDRLREGR